MIVRITTKYREVDGVHATPHTGIDFAYPQGTPLHPLRDGVAHVVDYGNANIGKGIIVKHFDGTSEVYGHLSKVDVKEGQFVGEATQLGLTGNSGHSTGAHLHVGMTDSTGHFVDPTPYTADIMAHVGNVEKYHIKGLGEWAYEKFASGIAHGFTHGLMDYLTDLLTAFPIIAVACFGTYAFIGILSKKGAGVGALLTFAYGALSLAVLR